MGPSNNEPESIKKLGVDLTSANFPQSLPDEVANSASLGTTDFPRALTLPPVPASAIDATVSESVQRSQSAHSNTRANRDLAAVSLSNTSEYLRTAVASSAIWSGLGAAIFCLESSLLAVAGHVAVGWQTLRNEVRLKRGGAVDQPNAGQGDEANQAYPGYQGLLSDTLKSPAFNTIATGVCYLAAAVQCFATGDLFNGAILTTYCGGLMSMSYAIASSYAGARTSLTLPEKFFRAAWSAVPKRLQTFLKNPSVWLAAGNLPLVAVTCNLGKIAENPLVTTPAVVGLLLSEFGLLTAIKTLVRGIALPTTEAHSKADPELLRKQEAANFAQGLLLNSVGHLLVGASSLMQGVLFIGTAKVCWCVACGILGLQKRAEATAKPRDDS